MNGGTWPLLYRDGEETPWLIASEPIRLLLEYPEVANGFISDDAGAWLNSAGIELRGEDGRERVSLSISLGDPRGAFVMEAERHPDGLLTLSVPHSNDGSLHLPLTRRGDGFYAVG